MNLTVRDLSKTYRNGVEALKEVNLTIPPGNVRLARTKRSRKVDLDADPGYAAGSGLRISSFG